MATTNFDGLNASLSWKLVGSVNGNTHISLPDANEYLLVFTWSTLAFSWNVCIDEMASTRLWTSGYYLDVNGYGIAQVTTNNMEAYISWSKFTNQDRTSASYLTVYCR